MTWTERFRLALHPPPHVGTVDTSLRFTDILFGFIIKEVFIRLANWERLDRYVHLQLIVTLALVLGSWIGYRRSTNRSAYEVKFINLPFVRFLVDQLMLLMYFRLAVVTNVDVNGEQPEFASTIQHTLLGIAIVFALYVIWDLLGIWMATSKDGAKFRYPKTTDKETQSIQDWPGFWISAASFIALGSLWAYAYVKSAENWQLVTATIVLIVYRIAKEIRTSWRDAPSNSDEPGKSEAGAAQAKS